MTDFCFNVFFSVTKVHQLLLLLRKTSSTLTKSNESTEWSTSAGLPVSSKWQTHYEYTSARHQCVSHSCMHTIIQCHTSSIHACIYFMSLHSFCAIYPKPLCLLVLLCRWHGLAFRCVSVCGRPNRYWVLCSCMCACVCVCGSSAAGPLHLTEWVNTEHSGTEKLITNANVQRCLVPLIWTQRFWFDWMCAARAVSVVYNMYVYIDWCEVPILWNSLSTANSTCRISFHSELYLLVHAIITNIMGIFVSIETKF